MHAMLLLVSLHYFEDILSTFVIVFPFPLFGSFSDSIIRRGHGAVAPPARPVLALACTLHQGADLAGDAPA